jgi:outer membrane protein OmpA-like peptidoglycan-associated protein
MVLLFFVSANGQKRSELFEQIDGLKMQLDSVMNEVAEARRNEKASQIKMESFEAQVTELQAANATLMKNLTTFTSVSAKNSDNFTKAMQTLREKEAQLSSITDALAQNDSTALVVLTNAKQTLGENAKIGVANNAVVISADLAALFGSDTTAFVSPEGEAWLKQVAIILKVHSDVALTIEGLSMTGDLLLPAQQAGAVSSSLQKLGVTADRITALGRDGDLKEGILLKLHPKYAQFYGMVKEHMKRSN